MSAAPSLPYMSLPLAYAQPAAVAALAALFGLSPPPPARARVLEIGCAAGGHIIPLAARFPEARFEGIDVSAASIEEGQALARAAGLENVELSRRDVRDFGGGRYDYIICHGLFSWTGAPVREAILALCGQALTPHGLAVVSCNVLPGWRIQQVVRDLALRGDRQSAAPQERAEAVRARLESIARLGEQRSPYGLAVQQAAARLAKRPASYILGEFLAPLNEPFPFASFAHMCAAHGLHYVCDGELGQSTPETMLPAAAEQIRGLAGGDERQVQALLDEYSGRPFRRSVLALKRPPTAVPRGEALGGLHAHATCDEATRGLQESNADWARAIAEAYPASAPMRGMVEGADAREAVLSAAAKGWVRLLACPLEAARASSHMPTAFVLARLQAVHGQRWVTSLRHEAAAPPQEALALLPLLDGTHSRDALRTLAQNTDVDSALRYLESEALLCA